MTYTIIIILIALLIICGIAATAIQQFNERKATEKREEVSRHRTIFEETEEAVAAAMQMPLSTLLIAILRKRSLNSLLVIYEHTPTKDIKNKVDDLKKIVSELNVKEAPPNQNIFTLPTSDKVILKYIQAVKKLRYIVRYEHAKGNIPPQVFIQEEAALASLQLRVNVETLMKRANDATKKNMHGSSRQYIEKAISALSNHKPQSDYTQERKTDLQAMLNNLESNLKDSNLKQVLADKEKERDDLETLFAPKKKW